MNIYYKLLKWLFLILLLSVFYFFSDSTSSNYHFNNRFIVNYELDNNFQNSIHDSVQKVVVDFLEALDTLDKDINTQLLEELILRHQYISKAEVYLDVEGALKIDIDFRQPFIRLLQKNKIYYFDSAGVMLPPLSKVDESLLIISGDLNKNTLIETFDLVNKIYSEPLLNKLIGGVHYDGDNGYILSAKACDLGVNIGSQPVLDTESIKMIELFYNFSSVKLTCGYCQSINITYDKQIICIN